jgi:hypothetical protein
MRLLVCGGRDFFDVVALREAMNAVVGEETDVVVIHGAARGADSLADQIAREAKVPVEAYPADWEKHGKRAGFLRNSKMLREGKPDVVLAAPGGRGTAMMVRIAKEAGVRVVEM